MRKKFSRLTASILSVAMIFSLSACGKSETGAESAAKSSASSAVSSSAAVTGTAAVTTTASGNDSAVTDDSPYKDKGYDLSKPVTIVMYVLGDKPADMDTVLAKANSDYFQPKLNSTLDIEFLNWSDYQTKYSLLLSGGEQVDLMYTASWCYYNQEVAAGAFKKLDDKFIKTYLPYTEKELPEVAWKEIAINGDIYAVPKGKATFTSYNAAAVRQDLIDKYKLTKPDSWDDYKKYLTELAGIQGETGVVPLETNANREQLFTMFCQANKLQGVTEGYDFLYKADNSENAPEAKDIAYTYMSDYYTDYAKQMAELAKAGVWSANAINDTSDSQAYFENGKSGSFVWNTTVFSAGKNLEKAKLGTYAVYDVTSDTKRSRGAYSVDDIAVTTKSQNPERAALVLDYMKSDVDLNRLLLGGIKGVHWDLDKDGNRVTLDKAADYPWNGWAWAINRQDEPDEAGLDQRQVDYGKHCDDMEFLPKQTGFTFNPEKVQNQYTAIQSVVDEYKQSFALGIYGDDTEKTLEEFRQALKDAGIEEFTKEFLDQYQTYKKANGI